MEHDSPAPHQEEPTNPIEAKRLKIIQEMLQRKGERGASRAVADLCSCGIRHVQSTWKKYQQDGIACIKAKPIGRPVDSGRLSKEQQSFIKSIIFNKYPHEVGLKGPLWNRSHVRELIWQHFKVTMTLQAIGGYLAKWDFTTNHPQQHA